MSRIRQVASEAATSARRLEEARMKRQLEDQARLARELAQKKAEEERLREELLRKQQEEEQARIDAEAAEQARLQAEAARVQAELEAEEARAAEEVQARKLAKKKKKEERLRAEEEERLRAAVQADTQIEFDEKEEEPKLQPSPMVVRGLVPTISFRPAFELEEDRPLPFQLNSARSLISRSKLLSRLNKK